MRDRIRSTHLRKYENVLFNKLRGWALSFQRVFSNKPDYHDLMDLIHCEELEAYKFMHKIGWDLFSHPHSIVEDIVKKWLNAHNIQFQRGNKSIIKSFELDFYIAEKRTAIEVNDTSSHNSTRHFKSDKPKSKNYHLNKTIACKKKRIHLIHIFEKDLDKLDIVLHPLLPKKVIGASKLKLKDNMHLLNFYAENNRQGAGNASKGLCLVDKTGNILVAMTITKSRYKSKAEYELYRYCVASGWNVKFGFERLFKNYLKILDLKEGDRIISYCDRTYNQCKVYTKNGFKYSHSSEPNYKWVKGLNWLSRESCQRHKLAKRFNKEKYQNKTWTEKTIMENEGYLRVYDCGNKVFMYQV